MQREHVARAHYEEAKKIADSVFAGLTLDEAVDFNGYRSLIQADYRKQDDAWQGRCYGEFVPMARYRRLAPEGVEGKTWWKKIQPLFDEDEGQAMSGFMFMVVEIIVRQNAREHIIL